MSKSVYNLNSQTINNENLCRYYMSKKVKNVKMKFGKIKSSFFLIRRNVLYIFKNEIN